MEKVRAHDDRRAVNTPNPTAYPKKSTTKIFYKKKHGHVI